jgi:hypothetical protein
VRASSTHSRSASACRWRRTASATTTRRRAQNLADVGRRYADIIDAKTAIAEIERWSLKNEKRSGTLSLHCGERVR